MKKLKNKNLKTLKILLDQTKKINLHGGIAECIKFENKNLLSKISLNNKNLIEFGCGAFPTSFGIEDFNMPKHYVATDTSKELILTAKKVDPRPIYKIINLEKKLNITNKKKFDVVILKHVLHHVQYPEIVLKKVNRILTKNGVVIISEPNLSSVIGNLLKWFLDYFFKISMEASPYGQYSQTKIKNSIKKSKMYIVKEWYSSLLAFPLTGDYGRKKIFPDIKFLFKLIIIFEKIISYFLHLFKVLAKITHFKVNFVLKKK